MMILFVALVARDRVLVHQALPTGFLPVEDQGYAILGVQLPDAASLERTHEVTTRSARS